MNRTEETDVRTLDIKEAYQVLTTELVGVKSKKLENIYKQARLGIDIKFDIYEYFNGNFLRKEKKGYILIHGRNYKLEDFYTEIENRNTLIKVTLMEIMEEEPLILSRA